MVSKNSFFTTKFLSGKFKGKSYRIICNEKLRPSKSRILQNILNLINYEFKGKIILELFAGNGQFGMEAISNGAMKVIFSDILSEPLKSISKNLKNLSVKNFALELGDSTSFLKNHSANKYDCIFLDAPYLDISFVSIVLQIISENRMLNFNGIIIVEKSVYSDLDIPPELMLFKKRKYGKIEVNLLTNF